jgi:hypothetical protein
MLHYSVLPASSERLTMRELGDLHFVLHFDATTRF